MLEKTGFISLLSVKSESFYYLPTFSRHQIINRPNLDDVNIDKKLLDNILAKFTDQSVINHGSISDQSVTIIGEEKDRDRDSSTPYNPPNIFRAPPFPPRVFSASAGVICAGARVDGAGCATMVQK